ncbi:hypothetical protein ACSFB8_08605 [Enterococcus faecalis]
MYLVEYDQSYYPLVEKFCISTEFLHQICEPFRAIELCKKDPNRHAILVIDQKRLVTFFVLHQLDRLNPYTQQQDRLLIRNFSIDYRHLGQGYTRKVFAALKIYIHEKFPTIDALLLMICDNQTAKLALYKQLGFKDTGMRQENHNTQTIILHYELDEPYEPPTFS